MWLLDKCTYSVEPKHAAGYQFHVNLNNHNFVEVSPLRRDT